MDFSEWLLDQLRIQNWAQAELARRAGVSRTAISDVLSGKRKAGTELCKAIAKALKLPEAEVFRQAGILEETHGENPPDINYLANALPDHLISEWIEYGRYLLDREEHRKKE